jgi:hypothetical protein
MGAADEMHALALEKQKAWAQVHSSIDSHYGKIREELNKKLEEAEKADEERAEKLRKISGRAKDDEMRAAGERKIGVVEDEEGIAADEPIRREIRRDEGTRTFGVMEHDEAEEDSSPVVRHVGIYDSDDEQEGATDETAQRSDSWDNSVRRIGHYDDDEEV